MTLTDSKQINIFWFRRDLRLEDNNALFHALNSGEELLPIFIFDKLILDKLSKDDARVTFIHELLENINSGLQKQSKSLAVFYGDPEAVWKQLITKHDIKSVFVNRDYEHYARERDQKIYDLLQSKNIVLKSYKDQVIFERNDIIKADGSPYVVYTPFSQKWKEKFREIKLENFTYEKPLHQISNHSYPFLNLDKIGFLRSNIKIAPFNISANLIGHYSETRDFPALAKTSMLGPYLRFGAISIRQVVAQAVKQKEETFLNELIWREFFMQILWHFPHTSTKSFKPQYDYIQWENSDQKFQKWCDGNTGYPLVDAGMRELNTTGYMHNRVRMVTASFLCKHLLIDWRWGEAYFASKLLDYEQSSNVGNWQWAAGSGVDAAPYFRIFNPTTQIQKFDKEHEYIKKWVPDLNDFSYPKPIVDHKEAREKCLKVYKRAIAI